ncbi:MAG: hypothetical protein A2X42_02515 [Candidatus Margulisbacteria bacterium GWF2_38_17]|nr:MAG: hypothetical protein A2X43_04005 [Candidatus Margulisbacteria bacterium GWD2_39_127]OGI05247.1 MAG: hypothetical protein A2X42_02515 [Candidatus Margulisbacteria bacterium GWF2_38_17]OGI06298.1 MAG: hypothetical protein A2X41_08095 [Candidatus Margulisbacteria bacterium GWE2_39_32]
MIGVMAAVLTSSGLIPQAIKGLKTKSLEDVSTGMLIILVCGTFLWFVYGLHKGDFIIIGANIVTCSFALIILLLKYVYNSKKNTI